MRQSGTTLFAGYMTSENAIQPQATKPLNHITECTEEWLLSRTKHSSCASISNNSYLVFLHSFKIWKILKMYLIDLDEEDYLQTKSETIQQMKEFEDSLGRVAAGNTILLDEVSKMKLALRTKRAEAFQAGEVIKLFSSKQPNELRGRLKSLQRDLKLGKLPKEQVDGDIVAVIASLKKLGEPLTEEEQAYLQESSSYSKQAFESVKADRGVVEKLVLSLASEQAYKR